MRARYDLARRDLVDAFANAPSPSQALKERDSVIAQQEERIKELTEEVESAKQGDDQAPEATAPDATDETGGEPDLATIIRRAFDAAQAANQLENWRTDLRPADKKRAAKLLTTLRVTLQALADLATPPAIAEAKAAGKNPRSRKSKPKVIAHIPGIGTVTEVLGLRPVRRPALKAGPFRPAAQAGLSSYILCSIICFRITCGGRRAGRPAVQRCRRRGLRHFSYRGRRIPAAERSRAGAAKKDQYNQWFGMNDTSKRQFAPISDRGLPRANRPRPHHDLA